MCLCVPAYAGMVGDSHNDRNTVGRARANVVYSGTPMVAVTKSENIEPEIEPEPEIVDEPEPVLIAEPEPDLSADIALASQYLAQLQSEIKQIDSEMARCRRAKNNWTIGTVVGSVGVVGTATGAIVQAVKINKAKKNGAIVSDDDADGNEPQDGDK